MAGTVQITNPDGRDPGGGPGFISLAPLIQAYYEWGGGASYRAKITNPGQTATYIVRDLPVANYGTFTIQMPPGLPAGTYSLVIDVDGVSQIWVYFSTGSVAPLYFGLSLMDLIYITVAAVSGVVIGYAISAPSGRRKLKK